MYQPKTGQACHCKRGQQRDNCPDCEGTGQRVDFKAIRERQSTRKRLEYLRAEIKAERISYGEIAELQSLAEYIECDDVLLREWAELPEESC